MTERVKIIPIELPFLKVFAEYFFNKFKEKSPDFSRILVIFPSERNKFYFRRYLLESAKIQGVIPPKMLTMEELIDFIYERMGGGQGVILENIERNFILKKTIDELKIEYWQDIPFLKFISIGNRLLNFYDELSQERISIDDIEKKSAELHFSERYVKNEIPILKRVYQRYRNYLIGVGYKDRIDEFEMIYEKYNSKIFEEFDYVMIAGIAATTSFEKFLLKNMLTDLPAELILHSGLPEEIAASNDTHKKFFLHYKLLNHLNLDIKKIKVIKTAHTIKPVIHIKALETITKQTFFLGNVLRESVKRYQEPHRIGVILTDDSLLFPVTEILKSYGIEYNLSAGLPFANLIFYSFLKHLFDAVKNSLAHSEFFVFIQHPLIKNGVINGVELRPLVYGLRNKMIKEKKRYFQIEKTGNQTTLQGLEPGFTPLINLLQRCFVTVQQDLNFNEYIDGLIKLLNDILSYNQSIIKANFPGIKEFFKKLHDLSRLRIVENAIPPGIETLEFILKILEGGKYHIEGEPLKGIQIIGVLEARNLDFDCVVLPAMNEGIFPRRSEKDMFINPVLRKEMGLISEEERNNLYYYYFTQLLSGKKEVHISYIAEEKNDIPSRFVMMLESGGFTEEKEIHMFIRNALITKERSVKKDDRVIKKILQRFKNGFSPSALRSYKSCPYQFYLRYLLEIEEPDIIPEEFDYTIWGSLFHKVVEEFCKKYYPSRFTKEEQEEAIKNINKVFDQYINSGDYVAMPFKPIVYFDMEVYKGYFRKFLEYETERFKEGYRLYPGFEEKKLVDSIKINNLTVPLSGFVDRIDKRDDYYYIIDYKTGNIPEKSCYKIGEEFVEFQLPLYGLMFSKKVKGMIGGLIYYKIGRKIGIENICDEGTVQEYLEEFNEKILKPTISEMIDLKVPFHQTKDKNYCENCSYIKLCAGR